MTLNLIATNSPPGLEITRALISDVSNPRSPFCTTDINPTR
nr:MAG TPA: hypothetical protein [Caudoviricetes sp.]